MDSFWKVKQAPLTGLTGMGGGVGSFMWKAAGVTYEEGKLFGSGPNASKWFLNTSFVRRSSPVQIGTNSNWIYFYSGGNSGHKMAVNSNKEMHFWSNNISGAWGNNNEDSSSAAYITSGFTLPGPWISATTGYAQSFGVKDDGTLWAWGENNSGSLGLNQPVNTKLSSPTQVGTNTNWQCIKAGGGGPMSTTMAIKTDGTLWMWGRNTSGMLGQNQQENYGPSPFPQCSSPVQVGTDTNWGTSDTSVDIFNERALANVSGRSCLALKQDNTLWSWGYRGYGQLGLNSGPNNSHRSSPTQVGTDTNWARIGGNCMGGDTFVYGVKQDNTLWMWGANGYGILGQNNRTKYSSPVQIPGTNWKIDGCLTGGGKAHMGITKTDGTFWTWGYAYMGGLGLNYGNYPSIYCVSSPVRMGNTSDWIWGAGAQEYQGIFLQKG